MHFFENVCGNNLQNEKAGWGSSYQRKRVSRIIQLLTNLDSRVRGNDDRGAGELSVEAQSQQLGFLIKFLEKTFAR